MKTLADMRGIILKALEEGVYPPGSRIDSVRELARAHDTSTVTVSRTLRTLAKDHLLEQGAGRGYFVPRSARFEATRTGTVGMLLGARPHDEPVEALAPQFREIATAVQEALLARKRSVLVMGGLMDDGGRPVELPVDALRAKHLRGLLVALIYRVGYLVELSAIHPLLVVLDMDASDLGIDSVSFDNVGSAAKMVQLLASDGARRIAFVGGPFPSSLRMTAVDIYDPCARERMDGWRAGHMSAGLEIDESLIRLVDHRDYATFERTIGDMLAEAVRPDAVLTEDPFAALKALEKAGVQAGEIAVAGWMSASDAGEWTRQVCYAALCDFGRMGRLGVEVLMRRLEQPEKAVERRVIFPTIANADGDVVFSG